MFQGYNNIINITLPESLQTIKDNAIYPVSIKYLFIPKGVINIEANPFDDNKNYEYIDVDKENPKFCSVNGILFTKDMRTIVYYPSSLSQTEYILPSSVTTVYFGALTRFRYLQKLIIPDTIELFPAAFCYYCNDVLKNIIIIRRRNQNKPKFGINSFLGSTLKESNITYIYSEFVMPTCKASLPSQFQFSVFVFILV